MPLGTVAISSVSVSISVSVRASLLSLQLLIHMYELRWVSLNDVNNDLDAILFN